MSGINVLSLFDGMSCGRISLNKANIKVANYFSSEIKQSAIQVANINFSEDSKNRLGDIRSIKGANLPKIDLLIGGSPCKQFSQSSRKRIGLLGAQSSLFYEYVRLLKECSPKYFLLENVRMKPDQQATISDILGCEPIVIQSSLVAPQLRHRLYWTNIKVSDQPTDTNCKLNDILTFGYADRDKARTLQESDSRPLLTPVKMAHRYFSSGFTTLIFKDKQHAEDCKAHYNKYFKGKSAKDIDGLLGNIDVSIYNGVRYLTREEREACQCVPRGYTNSITDNQAAGILGDGWTVDIIVHIFKYLEQNPR